MVILAINYCVYSFPELSRSILKCNIIVQNEHNIIWVKLYTVEPPRKGQPFYKGHFHIPNSILPYEASTFSKPSYTSDKMAFYSEVPLY